MPLPPVLQLVRQEQVDAARAELSARVSGDAESAFDAARARAGEARRAELEAHLAAAAEAAAAEAAEAQVRDVLVLAVSVYVPRQALTRGWRAAPQRTQANGEEPPEYVEPAIDIEAEVEAAMGAVAQPPTGDVTDADVLSALLEQEAVSKAAIVQGLALHYMLQQQEQEEAQ